MTIVVRAPGGYRAERRWIVGVVLGEWLGLDWTLDEHDGDDMLIGRPGDERAVVLPDVLFAVDESRRLTPDALPNGPVPRRPPGAAGAGVLRADEPVPVPYGDVGPPGRPLVELDDGGVRLRVDVFGGAFALLTRLEEVEGVRGPGDRDALGRYPAAAALAVREGFLRTPVVDVWVELLRAALLRLWPRLDTTQGTFRVVLSHDVDDPLSTLGRRGPQLARLLAADLVRRRSPGLALRRARAIVDARRGRLDRDPHDTFDLLMDVSERHGLRSAFHVLANNDVNPRGGRFDLVDHPFVGELMSRVHRRGHEVGFHAGFGTFDDAARTAEEFDHLRRVAERRGVAQESWGGRQHYLQWAPGTWRNWDDARLAYDATVAFREAVGFRTGTCHEYPVFDVAARRPLALREQPFQVMDVTLFGPMGLSPDAALDAVGEIARACRRFRGDLGILWHNDEVLRTARQQRFYTRMVEAVTRV